MTDNESKEKLDQIARNLATYQGPRFAEFPNVPLYMDQVVELLNRWLDPLYFNQKPGCITSSMINNYVKNSIVHPPLKKRYKAYHLAYLYVVMILKQCFTLQEIASLITIYTEISSSDRFSHDFDCFVRVFEILLHNVMEGGDTAVEIFDEPSWQQTLMVDVIRAAVCRLYGTYQIYSFNMENEENPSK